MSGTEEEILSNGSDSSSSSSSSTRSVLVITGMNSEAAIAAGSGVITVTSGGSADNLRTLLSAYNNTSIRAVISFGIAGGLDPSLQPGDVVVSTKVVDGTMSWTSTPSVVAFILKSLSSVGAGQFVVRQGASVGTDNDKLSISDKAALYAQTGAEFVDTESQVAAQFATAQGLPFAVVRSIADPASQSVPAFTTESLMPDGSVNLANVIASVASQPSQLPALMQVGMETEAALRDHSSRRSIFTYKNDPDHRTLRRGDAMTRSPAMTTGPAVEKGFC